MVASEAERPAGTPAATARRSLHANSTVKPSRPLFWTVGAKRCRTGCRDSGGEAGGCAATESPTCARAGFVARRLTAHSRRMSQGSGRSSSIQPLPTADTLHTGAAGSSSGAQLRLVCSSSTGNSAGCTSQDSGDMRVAHREAMRVWSLLGNTSAGHRAGRQAWARACCRARSSRLDVPHANKGTAQRAGPPPQRSL